MPLIPAIRRLKPEDCHESEKCMTEATSALNLLYSEAKLYSENVSFKNSDIGALAYEDPIL